MSKRSFGHIRKLPSGKHQASYTSPRGVRLNAPHTFLTRGDASAWLSAQEVQISSGKWSPATSEATQIEKKSTDFRTFVERHITLQTNADGSLLRESTKNLYRRLLRVNLKAFHLTSVEEISAAQVSEWWAGAISRGKKTSASKAYKLLSSAMRRAISEKLIAANPCNVKGAHSASSGKKIGTPTMEEVVLIAQKINPRYSRMVILMAFGGFRFSEVTELRRNDVRRTVVNKQECYVFSIERAVTLVGTEIGKGFHHVDKPKSEAGSREVVVSAMLTRMIDEILSDTGESGDSLLFPAASDSRKHLRHDVFMNSWRPALKRAGIAPGKYAPHCLRHFAGSHLHLAGANIPELKEWLGDKSTAAVMRYVHATGRTGDLANAMLNQEIVWRSAS
jgi:integrase